MWSRARLHIVALAILVVAKLAAAEPTWRPTAALAAGVHSTDNSNYVGDDTIDGSGGYLDGEVGVRRGRVAVVAFVRWAHYVDPDVQWLYDTYNVTRDDLYFGARFHVWPRPWLRLSGGGGVIAERQRDVDLGGGPESPAMYAPQTAWIAPVFGQVQAAVIPIRLARFQLEIGVDAALTSTGTVTLAGGLGVRL